MNNSKKNKINLDNKILFSKIKEIQKLPDEVIEKFLSSKGKLKNKIFSNVSFNEKQN